MKKKKKIIYCCSKENLRDPDLMKAREREGGERGWGERETD